MILGLGLLVLFGQLKVIVINFIWNEFLLTMVLYVLVSFSEEILLGGYVLRNFMESMNNVVAPSAFGFNFFCHALCQSK